MIKEAKIFLEFPTREVALEDDDMLYGNEIDQWLPEFKTAWKQDIGLPIHGNVTPNTVVKVSDNTLDTMAELVEFVQMDIQAARRDTLKLFNRQLQNEEQPPNPRDLTHYRHKHIKKKGRTIKYGPMPTSPASARGLLPSSCPILRAGRSTLSKTNKMTRLFFNAFGIKTQNSNRSDQDIGSILVA